MEEGVGLLVCCLVCCLSVTIGVMLSCSYGSLATTEWGLSYSWWSEAVDPTPLTTAGLVYLGIGNTLIKYPNINKHIYFRSSNVDLGPGNVLNRAFPVRTNDGLRLELELEFSYRLRSDKLYDLYMLSGPDAGTNGHEAGYLDLLMTQAKGSLETTATSFVAKEYYLNRTLVADRMLQGLREVLGSTLWIDVQTLQLQNSNLPHAYTEAIRKTSVLARNISVAEQERKTRLIQANTQKLKAETLANKTVMLSTGQAATTLIDNEVKTQMFQYMQQREADGYKGAVDFFRGSGSADPVADFLRYMQTRILEDHAQSKSTIQVAPR
eukprot:TRINITY_DN8401_c0_g1_i1.p1 TRINITY_DN8401_c0_g1~~TRINITY_DN8401_c0_g1_i1.p1  ORF type:complete len:324 (-),score=70.23 TRINITY_DN8401_c0_g1_i1:248-1219(-)